MVASTKKSAKGRVLLGASHSVIENLGLIYLGGLARDEGWERKYSLVRNHDFSQFFEDVRDFKPDVVGFNIYTGAHNQLFEAFDRLRKDFPDVRTAIGGPHATYFPEDAVQHADFAVMSEGFRSFRKILRREVGPGILELKEVEEFPRDDREGFYRDSQAHGKSPIKSIIGMTGCPYRCKYCYNSTDKSAIIVPKALVSKNNGIIELSILAQDKKSHGMGGRLFPLNERNVDDVLMEGRRIVKNWPETRMLYFQDDVFGFDTKPGGFLEQLAERWPREVGIPFHAQMRWEMAIQDGERRLDLIKKAGSSGMTLAIEAADSAVREEVLDRNMPEQYMFEGMKRLVERGFKVRTEQITALPYGYTTIPTKMNLDADLEVLELNVRLREATSGPVIAWASTLAPYKRTKIGDDCEKYGYYNGNNNDVPDEFFKRSVLKFPKEWIGPKLAEIKNNPEVWLSESELERYRDQNTELRNHFNTFALIPDGHKLAEKYLKSSEPFSYERLGREIENHLKSISQKDSRAEDILETVKRLRSATYGLDGNPKDRKLIEDIHKLAPYISVLPKAELMPERVIRYAREINNGELSPYILSTVVRHHLYENALYEIDSGQRPAERERYPAKI